MKKIVIRIISYNQEKVISRALDSLLCQKEWGLYKIVVSDDCSKDLTWEILQEYKKQYPEIMDIHRNEHNLGIYGNLEKAESYLPDYDLFGSLAGDDAYCEGYFEAIQKLVDKENIDTTKPIGIYSDWMFVSPNGAEHVFKQDAVLTGHRLWSLKARGKISGRSLMMTKSVRSAFAPFLEGKGLNLTESNYDAQPHLNIERAYYLPQVTSKYYTGIGVSNRLVNPRSSYNTTENIEKWEYAIENYIDNERDLHYARYQIIQSAFYLQPSWGKMCQLIIQYIKGQLPGCRNSLKNSIRMIGGLLKYRLKNK